MRRADIHRPLLPVCLCFAGGVFIGHEFLSSPGGSSFPVLLAAALCLLTALCLPPSFKPISLLPVFFLVGIFGDSLLHRESKLAPMARERRSVVLEGTVLEPPRIDGEITRVRVMAQTVFHDGKEVAVNESVSVTVYRDSPPFRPNERIRFPARLRSFKNFQNPGAYDYASAMELKGFSCSASVSDGRRVVGMGEGKAPFPRGLLEKVRAPVRDFLQDKLPPRESAVFQALILGEQQGIDDDLRELFNRTGLGHLLSVSGLHIGLIASVGFLLFGKLLSRSYRLSLRLDIRRSAALLNCVPVVLYTGLAGFQVSAQRAMIMVLVFLGSIFLRLEGEIWSSVALAALMVLVWDPHALFSISFQLSFMAVIGILWLTPPLLEKIPGFVKGKETLGVLRRLSGYFLGLAMVSLTATIFLLPLSSFYFHRVSLVTLPANLTALPALGLWILPVGLLSAASLFLSPALAEILLQMSAQVLHGVMWMVEFWAGTPRASLWLLTPNGFEMVLAYALLFLIPLFRRRRWAKFALLPLLGIVLADAGYWLYTVRWHPDLRVTYLDVGQGSAALVEFPRGKRMLIDGGGFPTDHADTGEMIIGPFLWRNKVGSVDYIVLSHPHADHMNGLRFVSRNFHPAEFWYNGDGADLGPFRELMGILDEGGVKRFLPADLKGGREINGVKVEVLHPGPPETRDRRAVEGEFNNRSLVLKISFGGTAFLFPGDLERAGEEEVALRASGLLKSEVLLVPHHGCESSICPEFLNKVRPTLCIISSGEANRFGFPHQKTVAWLRQMGAGVIRIDQEGAVSCVVSPGRLNVRTFAGGERLGTEGMEKGRVFHPPP